MSNCPDRALLTSGYCVAWRSNLSAIDLSLTQVTNLLPVLLPNGGAGLLWPRIRHRSDEYGAVGEMLERAYQQHAGHLDKIEAEIATLASMMSDAGIEAVLVKGWALSSLYAAPQVRRPGDIDLIVPTDKFAEAQGVVSQAFAHGVTTGVDLYNDDTWRSQPSVDFRQHLVYRECSGAQIATLGATDALRHVCLHFVKHLRNPVPNTSPLWLCDIGVLVENSRDIDWQRLFDGDAIIANRIRLALALSRDIVGTDPASMPDDMADFKVSDWAHESVLRLWIDPHAVLRREIAQFGVRRALVKRLWPSPLNAALRSDASFDTTSPVLFQLRTCTRLLATYGTRILTLGKVTLR